MDMVLAGVVGEKDVVLVPAVLLAAACRWPWSMHRQGTARYAKDTPCCLAVLCQSSANPVLVPRECKVPEVLHALRRSHRLRVQRHHSCQR